MQTLPEWSYRKKQTTKTKTRNADNVAGSRKLAASQHSHLTLMNACPCETSTWSYWILCPFREPVRHPPGLQPGPAHPHGEGRLPACALQQRALSLRQLDAPAVLLRVGKLHPRPVQLHRPCAFLEREAVPAEYVDQEGLRPGLPVLFVPLRSGPPKKRHRLVSGEAHAAGGAQEKAIWEELGQKRCQRGGRGVWGRALRRVQEEQATRRSSGRSQTAPQSLEPGATSETVSGPPELFGKRSHGRTFVSRASSEVSLWVSWTVPSSRLPLPLHLCPHSRRPAWIPSFRRIPQICGPHRPTEEEPFERGGGVGRELPGGSLRRRRAPGPRLRPPAVAVVRAAAPPAARVWRRRRGQPLSLGAVPQKAGPFGAAHARAAPQSQHLPRAHGGRRPGGPGRRAAQVVNVALKGPGQTNRCSCKCLPRLLLTGARR